MTRVMHYTDDMGVEADAVYQLEDGRYALIEIKNRGEQDSGSGKILAAIQGYYLKI